MLQKLSQKQIGEKFGISQAGVSQIVKKRSSIEAEINTEKNENRKRISDGQTFPKVNAAVLEWYQRVRGRNLPVTGPMLQQIARTVATFFNVICFVASNGWLQSFKTRNVRLWSFCWNWKLLFGAIWHLNRAATRDILGIVITDCRFKLLFFDLVFSNTVLSFSFL